MNETDLEQFEDYLRQQPLQGTPPGWRHRILTKAASSANARTGTGRSRMWSDLCVEWMWPKPIAWAALAAVWVAIFVLNQLAAPSPDELAEAKAGAAIAEANLPLLGRLYELDVTADLVPVGPAPTPKNSQPDQGSSRWSETSVASQT